MVLWVHDSSCGLYRFVHRLASCMVGMIQNLGRSLCLSSSLKLFRFLHLFSLSCKRLMIFFLYLSKEIPDADCITASPPSRYNPTLVKSMFFMDFSKYV